MPIKNYTTSIDPSKTAGQISRILAKFRARRVQQEFDDQGELIGLCFSIVIDGTEVGYRLPARPEGVLRTLRRDQAPARYCTMEHARKVAWRIVKDWVDSQLAMIEAGSAEPDEIFLPYMVTPSGQTVYERMVAGGGVARALLGPGEAG